MTINTRDERKIRTFRSVLKYCPHCHNGQPKNYLPVLSARENPDEDRVGAEGMINDIGTYVGRRLTDEEKYYLLTEAFIPVRSYAFPATLLNNCNRRFRHQWLESYEGLVYSPSLDACFCQYCFLFEANKSGRGHLTTDDSGCGRRPLNILRSTSWSQRVAMGKSRASLRSIWNVFPK